MPYATVGKCSCPTGVPSVNLLKPRLNTAVTTASRHRVNTTPRMADAMPLIRIMSSGTTWRSLTMRAARSTRANFAIRRTEVCAANPPPTGVVAITAVITHTSVTSRTSSKVSKTNHPSLMVSEAWRKARNRMSHSPRKYTAKRCSTAWKATGDWSRRSAGLASASMHIQRLLRVITPRVRFSKCWLLAMLWKTPADLYNRVTLYTGSIKFRRIRSFIPSASGKNVVPATLWLSRRSRASAPVSRWASAMTCTVEDRWARRLRRLGTTCGPVAALAKWSSPPLQSRLGSGGTAAGAPALVRWSLGASTEK
mmetsp:Transcript_16890/g.43064  ORF Transcript_16890/g.43064 Transcript_16890/m.43064 type:complete len:310 (-) Transcript_16890:26-955(-)